MSRRLLKMPSRAGVLRVLALALILALAILNAGNRALADVDPPGCSGNGVQVSLRVFRADGVTEIPGGDITEPVFISSKVSDGEVVILRATLRWDRGTAEAPQCAFESGNWSITTPAGTLVPIGPVPRLGDPNTGTGAVPSVTSAPISYTVNHSHEKLSGATPYIQASTAYTRGFFHDSSSDSSGDVGASTALTRDVIHPDLHLAKTDSPDPVVSGNPLTYTIIATNDGAGDAPNTMVTDTWPAGFTPTIVTPSQGSCASTNPLSCNLGTIAGNGGTATVTVVGTVAGCSNLANSANVSTSATEQHGADAGNTDNSATATTTVQCADANVTKAGSPGTVIVPVAGSGALTYTITANNAGSAPAANATVTDSWPAGFTATQATPSQGSCPAPLNPTLTCNLGTIAAGGSASVTVVGTVAGCSNLTNTASVGTTTPETNAGNNVSPPVGTVVQCATQPQTRLQVQDRMRNLPPGATGSVTYSLFANSDCTGLLRPPETIPIAGSIAQDGLGPLSTVFVVNPGVTVYFQADYTSNSPNFPSSTSPCIKEQASVGQ